MTGLLRLAYLGFCGLISLTAWMLCYALTLRFVFADGRVLEMMATTNPLAPLIQFAAYADSPILQRVALWAALPAFILAVATAYAGLRSRSEPFGEAAFQTTTALRRGGWFGRKGKIFGCYGRKLLRVDDDRHHLVIGPTRSGKGAGYVIPNALMHEGSMIITDLKGEIFRSTAGYRQKKGNRVFLFSPGAERTHRYNPLDFIRTDRGSRTTDIQNIAAHLVPENTDSENAVWQVTAQQILAGVISYVEESVFYAGRRNLGEVNAFFNCGVDLQALIELIKEKEPDLSRFTQESFNAYMALSERAAASSLLDVQKALRPFRNERIVAATTVTDMDLQALKRRPVTIYLAPSITDVALLKPLLSLFVKQAIDVLTLEPEIGQLPVYFLLDEFRQLGKLTEITSKLPYMAGYGCKFAFVIQDLKNLDEIYGETVRHSLLGNCGYQLILGANDQATADYVSRALGKRTIRYNSESRSMALMGLHRRTKTEQIRERDLMMAQEVRQLPPNKIVLLAEGQRPIRGGRLRYFETRRFSDAEKYARAHVPDIPTLEMINFASTPATTKRYADAGRVPDELESATNKSRAEPELGSVNAASHQQASAYRRDDQDQTTTLEARFAFASSKLRTLVNQRTDDDWRHVLDTTLPEEDR
jgi:type IV secretion system protein VirD4